MQVIILCGGKGTRLGEVTGNQIPKPMASVGEQPILWHIMKYYSKAGYNDFVLCTGHLSHVIKDYFLNYHMRLADVRLNTSRPHEVIFESNVGAENWNVTIAETGEETMTAGRLRRVMKYIEGDRFMLTYGDGVSNVDLRALHEFHISRRKAITLTGVIPRARFGELVLDGDHVREMAEKPVVTDRYINGGFMVMEKRFVECYIDQEADDMMLERAPMAAAAEQGEMAIFRHNGFWQCMDTYRDWVLLNDLWKSGEAPWK